MSNSARLHGYRPCNVRALHPYVLCACTHGQGDGVWPDDGEGAVLTESFPSHQLATRTRIMLEMRYMKWKMIRSSS